MATVRPFAYNTGTTLSGTVQYGTLSVGVDPNNPYNGNYGGIRWWNGPDEDLGYCIGTSVPSGDQPTPFGNIGTVTFWRTQSFDDNQFISLSKKITGQNLTSANESKLWLNDNGYWTSYDSSVVTPNPTPSITPTITPTSSEVPLTPTPTPSSTPTSGPTPSGFTVNIYESGSDVVMSVSGNLNINDLSQIASGSSLGNEGLIVPVVPTFIMSPATPPFGQFDLYSGFTSGPSNLGAGGFSPASSFIGDVFGIVSDSGNFQLFTPVGYESSDPISSTQTFAGQSFTSLGLVEGTYTYTWGSGLNAEVINIVVGGTPPPPPPSSGLTVTIQEVGSDVVWSGSGSLDLTNLILDSNSTLSAGFDSSNAIWGVGPVSSTNVDFYGGPSFTTYPISFGTPPGTPATSGIGNIFGILPGGTGRVVVVPENYVSGSPLSGSTTYENTTISGMNLISGTYTYSWGSGNGETLTLIIG